MPTQPSIPPGFTLQHTLSGHTDGVTSVAWSPDGRLLASGSDDKTIRLWEVATGKLLHTLSGHTDGVYSVAWSPNGLLLASGSLDETVRLWEAATGKLLHTLSGHTLGVYSVAWSPNGRLLASGSLDETVRLWEVATGKPFSTLSGHTSYVLSVAWSPNSRLLATGSINGPICLWDPQTGKLLHTLSGHTNGILSIAWPSDGRLLASGSADRTIRLWEPSSGRETRRLEGYTRFVTSISFSSDSLLLASKSDDDTVCLWRTDIWERIATLSEPTSGDWSQRGLAFHPSAPMLATAGEQDRVIHIWELDYAKLLGMPAVIPSVHYRTAKVVLVGESGVGKTGLALVLTGQPFRATESSHGRHIWPLERREVQGEGNRPERRETLLWDLAGQPDYRLIHQLHLGEVSVALLVFDASRGEEAFRGVRYWMRALRLAQQASGEAALPLRTFLVAARLDRGGSMVSVERVWALAQELGCAGSFGTSAKEGWQIAELRQAILAAIPWENLPLVTSTELFQQIQQFVLAQKQQGRVLCTQDELYIAFLRSKDASKETPELRAQFETCLGHGEAAGFLRRLGFGNLLLLQPELLDAYASALLIAVRNSPGELGSISEERVRRADFPLPQEERLADPGQERLLLLAMIEELLRQELALREYGDLIFPSQVNRERPDLVNPAGKAVSFSFAGAVLNIYTTLAVRLSHSGIFRKQELWRNAVTYTTHLGGTYGLLLRSTDDAQGELLLFFDQAARQELRLLFEHFIHEQLEQRALPNTIQRKRLYVCPNCGESFTEKQVQYRREHGFDWIRCSSCDTTVSLIDKEERPAAIPSAQVAAMNTAADLQRERSADQALLEGKRVTGDFDVFLCHKGSDKPKVKMIGQKLKERGINPWLDEEQLRPGLPWERLLEQQITQIKSAAVFVGKDGIGPWQQEELEAFLRQFNKRGCPVIPVILDDLPPNKEPQLPLFLDGRTWVDFRKQDPEPLDRLIWGITGQREPLPR